MARLIPEPLKNKRLLLLMMAVIIPGLVIGYIGFVSVSQQKQSRELKLYEKLRQELLLFRDDLQRRLEKSIASVYQLLEKEEVNFLEPEQVHPLIKNIILKHPVVHYPFIINSRRKFLFPLSRSPSSLMSQTPISKRFSPGVKEKYELAEVLEFRERNFTAAIQTYSQCLNQKPVAQEKTYILYAIARCYYKLNKFPQVISYLTDIEKTPNLPAITDKSFYFLFLRQMASTYVRLNQQPNALRTYLTLYEEILKYESTTTSDEFTFFKNESLDFLNRHIGNHKSETQRFTRAKALDHLGSASPVDISLRWRFFDLESGKENPISPDERKERILFFTMQELYQASDEKTKFYQRVKRAINWPRQTRNSGIQHQQIKISAAAETLFTVFKTISGSSISNRTIFFGFHISKSYLQDNLIASVIRTKLDPQTLILKLVPRGVNPSTTIKPAKYSLMTTPMPQPFANFKLSLLSSRRNYIKERVKREILGNYIIIAAFLISLSLGIVLLYKYLVREMELVKLKSNFVDSASHTLKTPLTRIRMLAEKFQLGWIANQDKKEEYLQIIISETDRMTEMINNMLNFSKIEAGKKVYDFQQDSLPEVIRSYIEPYQQYLHKLGFLLDLQIDANIPPFPLDAEAIKLILNNLIQNAIKYSLTEKHLKIEVFRDNDQAVIQVIDQGIGIRERDQEQVFKKFFRVEDERIKAMEGSGLGLYLVQHAVQAHHGQIQLLSSEGMGSTFIISLPMQRPGYDLNQEKIKNEKDTNH